MTTDTPITPAHRPLGFWLSAVDRLLRREFVDALADDGLDRGDWRLLNAIAGDVEAPALAECLLRKPRRVLALADRGWVAPSGSGWQLTEEGRAAKERIGEKTAAIRERVSRAVPEEDFATMLSSLEAIARELGWKEGVRLPPRGRTHGKRGHGRVPFGPWAGRRFLARAHAHRMAHRDALDHEECGFAEHLDQEHGFRHGHRGFGRRRGFERHGFGPGFEADSEHGFAEHLDQEHGVRHGRRGFGREHDFGSEHDFGPDTEHGFGHHGFRPERGFGRRRDFGPHAGTEHGSDSARGSDRHHGHGHTGDDGLGGRPESAPDAG